MHLQTSYTLSSVILGLDPRIHCSAVVDPSGKARG